MMDTLILGGGLAGCAAALWLADHGHTTTLVEARPRLGGRTLSRDWNGLGPVDFGGSWIRADHVQVIGLAHRLGLTLTPRAPISTHSYFRDGASYDTPSDDMQTYTAALTQLQADTRANFIQTMTLTEYLDYRDMPAELRREILAWWAISGSGDPALIGANELLTPKLTHGLLLKLQELSYTVAQGAMALTTAAAHASNADQVLGDPAHRLDDHGDHVQATLTSGRVVQARTALIALPLNAYAQIRFTPPLAPPQQRLRHQGHAGRAIKLLIRATGPQPGHLATGEAMGLRWIYADRILPDGSTLLIAFGLYDETGEPDRTAIAQALQAAFPGATLLDHDWHDWCADPFAQGTWVSPLLTTLPDYDATEWQPSGNLAFAGSDLYSAEQGWFEGAALTARSAANALHQRLKAPTRESPEPRKS